MLYNKFKQNKIYFEGIKNNDRKIVFGPLSSNSLISNSRDSTSISYIFW